MKNYITYDQLGDFLGYSDKRTIEKWCIDNKIPSINIGKSSYIQESFFDLYLYKETLLSTKSIYGDKAATILEATENKDLETLQVLTSNSLNSRVLKTMTIEKSEDASALLNKYKNVA